MRHLVRRAGVVSRHYLDHASTSPPRPPVVAAVTEWMARVGDPGRLHTEGLEVRAAIEAARDAVAALVGVTNREVVFTSGATESVAAAIWGALERHRLRNPDAAPARVAVSAVEHSCVTESAARAPGGTVSLAVDDVGRLDIDALDAALDVAEAERPTLVCVQWANHEVGTIQPVAEVAARCRAAGVLSLVDAASAVGQVPVDLSEVGADLVALSGHKMGGPPGLGALVVRRGLRVPPLLVGGAQERARRAGFENVPAIMGLGAAAEAVADQLDDADPGSEAARARARTARIAALAATHPRLTVFGDPTERVPHIVCLGVDGVEAEAVLVGLDRAGIAVHSGSACSSELLEPSPVLAAMGAPADRSLRASVGWSTTDDDVEALCRHLPRVINDLGALGRPMVH